MYSLSIVSSFVRGRNVGYEYVLTGQKILTINRLATGLSL